MRPAYILATLLTLTLFAACKKDDPTDPVDNNPQPETSLTFIAIDDSVNLSGVLVGITPNQADRDNGIFLRSGETGFNGQVKFSGLTPNTYYYSATWPRPGNPVTRTGSVEAVLDVNTNKELNF